MTKRHAYLILAHNQYSLLQELVKTLDHAQNDIYIHIDRKSALPESLRAEHSQIHFVEPRVDVRWGHESQIWAEMSLFKYAVNQSVTYDYYHLISGTHLPLYGQAYIHRYFEEMKGKQVLAKWETNAYQTEQKVRRYNLFMRNFAHANPRIARLNQVLWRMGHMIQRLLGVRRNKQVHFYFASNWVSLTHAAVQYIVSQEREVRKIFRYSLCGDEYFVPTILENSDTKWDIVYADDLLLHEIGVANARTFTMQDLALLRSSPCLFARKFSEQDMELVHTIVALARSRT